MQWLNNSHVPELGQIIRYYDTNGSLHNGIFDMRGETWLVRDIIGGITTEWQSVIEWQGNTPALCDLHYQNFIIQTIDAELA